jgi:hypothetical protein
MAAMTENNSFDQLENVISDAHDICDRILLFEALEMNEDEVRLFLYRNHVSDQKIQDMYLGFVRQYDRMTSSRKTPWSRGI